MKKRILALLLAGVMALGSVSVSFAKEEQAALPYTDVAENS